MNLFTRNRAIGLGIAGIVLALDLAIKGLMLGPLRLQQVGHIDLLPFFDFTWTQNYGVSLGMFTATSSEGRWMLVGVTAAIAIGVLVWIFREKKLGDITALALILGGALGNIRDRAVFGYVVDYADLHFGEFRPFMIFNLADAAITIGVVIILARSLFLREKPQETSKTADEKPA